MYLRTFSSLRNMGLNVLQKACSNLFDVLCVHVTARPPKLMDGMCCLDETQTNGGIIENWSFANFRFP
jgi:hypothetical protein